MKILWFTWKDLKNPTAGGAELVNEELAKRLVAEGHEVTFIVANFKGRLQETVNRERLTGLDRITLFPSSQLDVARGQDYERVYVETSSKITTPYTLSPEPYYTVIRVGNRWSVYNEARKYYKQHLEGWADLVIDEVNTVPFFASFYVKEPVVLFIHQLARKVWFYQLPKPLGWMGYGLEPLYLRLLKNHTAITVSESTRQDLIRHGYKAENIHIISEGIELEPLMNLEVEKFARPTLLSLGSVRPMKRTLDQIKAFEIAKSQFMKAQEKGKRKMEKVGESLTFHHSPLTSGGFDLTKLRLIIAGELEGDYGKKVLEYIRRSPFRKDIEVTGKVDAQKKATLLQKAHLTLSTSVKEGWGLTITEANSQGTPAVVYDVDGLRDAVKHNQTGLVSEESPQSLAKDIVALLRDSNRYQKFRTAAHDLSKSINFDKSHNDFKKAIKI